MPIVDPIELQGVVAEVFVAAGALPRHAEAVAEHLVEANLAGHDSHGVLRVPQYLDAARAGQLRLTAEPRTLVDTVGATAFDAEQGFGQVVAPLAMQTAVDKAGTAGVAASTVRNAYHSGRLASYSKIAATQGFVGVVMVNAGGGGQSVAPFGGAARRLATNPLSIAAPGDPDFPLVLDIATSVAPEGKLRDVHQQGKPAPPGWLIDFMGNPTTDPADYYDPPGGALLPFGGPVGHKGFGLAFMIDILAGALSGAGCCRDEVVDPYDGMLLMAIDVQRFGPVADFRNRVQTLVEYVKSCPPAAGFSEVLVPGEIEHRERQRRVREGLPIDSATWHRLLQSVPSDSVDLARAVRSDVSHQVET